MRLCSLLKYILQNLTEKMIAISFPLAIQKSSVTLIYTQEKESSLIYMVKVLSYNFLSIVNKFSLRLLQINRFTFCLVSLFPSNSTFCFSWKDFLETISIEPEKFKELSSHRNWGKCFL